MNKISSRYLSTILLLAFVALTSSATLAQNVWAWEDVKSTETGSGYEFVSHTPYLRTVPGQTELRFDWHRQIEKMIETEKANFTKYFRESQAEREERNFKSADWNKEINYQVVWQDELNLIVSWHGYEFSGGAHGNQLQMLSIFRKDTPEVYTSSAFLFDHQPKALAIISRESRAGLVKLLGKDSGNDEWMLKGSAPDWKNFSMCYPTVDENGQKIFRMTFAPYQVGPYAIGTPTVDIPWKKLAPYAVNVIF